MDSRLRFDLVLTALPEEAIEQIRSLLHTVDQLEQPYVDLKARLLKIYTPKPLDQCFKILYASELQGDRRPSQMLESLLALLPPGEVDGLLFKTIFLTKLPSDIRDHVAAQLENLSSREMGRLADNWWFARNQRLYGEKSRVPVAAVLDERTV